ncbi:MAG: hypothetical protein HFP77_08125 [Methylococcales symbiont of Iophon sp. n. MRB-2018]|nr:MAG: hypothetical protein HFP77_08125 [Methylococcales symbiont of Iophon sp. n. MRB-2018]KAF3979163.1 MAG: hypothetical protein HFP76_08695 [Methylococcales symbiont of Iophon sp. n. MRB-2018]
MVVNIVEKSQKEVDRNYDFFKTQISQLKSDHLNEFALLHDKKINDFFISEDDAIRIGTEKYGEGNFSVQRVNDSSIELGYQSYL